MDFYTLARRDLQALCKKNQIAANQTNVAMADALASLDHVEGLDEFLNQQPKHDAVQSPEKENPPASVITRSMNRASTRRRTVLVPETEQLPSQTTGGRSMRNRNAAAADKESKILNFTETPIASRIKKRAEPASVQLKVEKEKAENEKNEEGDSIADGTANTVAKTRQGKARAPVAQSTRMSTRRSARLLEKKMNDLKLSDEVTMILEPIKMGDLIAEKELTEESVDTTEDEHPSDSVKEDTEAKVVVCKVVTSVEVGPDVKAEGKSEPSDPCEAESKFNATPVKVESASNNAQGKKFTESTEEAEAVEALLEAVSEVEDLDEAWSKVEEEMRGEAESKFNAKPVKVESASNNAQGKKFTESTEEAEEVEALVEAVSEVEVLDEAWSEVEEEMQSRSAEIYRKEEIAAAESEVDAPAEVENGTECQNKKLDEVDGSLVGLGTSHDGLTSFEEAANGYVHAASAGKVAPNDGDDIAELTAQVTSWNLDCPKEDSNKEMDSEVVSIAASDVNTSILGDGEDVAWDEYLADTDGLSKLTAKVKSPNDDSDGSEIQGVTLSAQPYIAEETRLVEAQVGLPQTQKSVEAVDVEMIRQALKVVKDSNHFCADDIVGEKTPASTIISKANSVPQLPSSVGRMTELPTLLKSSGKKLQSKDGDKENVGSAVKFGKQKKVPELIVKADEEKQKPNPLTTKSLLQLRKMYKEKIQMQNEKRPALQTLPENNNMAVAED
ncbi:hypothetical protein MLD38_002502 [Melastoma candidum]|uniref:Uncharacterized protein n=1 Tax=Melastoma candidum TaxID=119954 RepID=A0ACB9RYT1_9MYRT|nr:hypothetical protein MLD38_002502 [Melastoma candidum]